jgi:hypothetical protein
MITQRLAKAGFMLNVDVHNKDCYDGFVWLTTPTEIGGIAWGATSNNHCAG